jgi:hypothetical protein
MYRITSWRLACEHLARKTILETQNTFGLEKRWLEVSGAFNLRTAVHLGGWLVSILLATL